MRISYVLKGDLTQLCSGPGFTVSDFYSNYLIGQMQYEGAKTVMSADNRTVVSGGVKSVHIYMDMYGIGPSAHVPIC